MNTDQIDRIVAALNKLLAVLDQIDRIMHAVDKLLAGLQGIIERIDARRALRGAWEQGAIR